MKVRVFIAGAILLFSPGVNAQGIITTVAGTGTFGFGGATAAPPPAPSWASPLA